MAITYASKAAPKAEEFFSLKSVTDGAFKTNKFTWEGVNSINVFSFPTTALGDYTLTGLSRYGTPVEQQNTYQNLAVTKDRAVPITIDKKTMQDLPMAKITALVMKQEMEQVYIPEVDTYRIGVAAAAAVTAGGTATLAVTAANAYKVLLDAQTYFGNNKVPMMGKVMWCSYAYYAFIKQDPAFMLASDTAMKLKVNGAVGEIDGVEVVPVPSNYLPANTAFVIIHPTSVVACQKLEDYVVHENPPGINGALLEMRFRHDAYVLDAKVKGVYTHKIA